MANLIINIRLFKPFVAFFSTRQHNNKKYHDNEYCICVRTENEYGQDSNYKDLKEHRHRFWNKIYLFWYWNSEGKSTDRQKNIEQFSLTHFHYRLYEIKSSEVGVASNSIWFMLKHVKFLHIGRWDTHSKVIWHTYFFPWRKGAYQDNFHSV
jgi:hypothetical protein